ncbi:MAG TPA: hypothetical protein VN862_05695 [Candidatus Acidoferrales bacterium]|nr:hypothetical protein [Candidatus Acidoferrales bacterium]
MARMPMFAPLAVLAFLGAGAGLFLMVIVFLFGVFSRKYTVAKIGASVALAGVIFYAVLLFSFSAASHEQTLAMGEHKYFCEVDCHIAYSVQSVTRQRSLGPASAPLDAAGVFYIVRLQTWFDPATISATRGDGPLMPSPHRAVIVDGAGREYPSSCLALAELGPDSAKTPLLTPLRPGESYVTDFVFDLPATISNPRLLVKDDDFVTSFVIGHEDSPFHKKVLFALNPANSATLR